MMNELYELSDEGKSNWNMDAQRQNALGWKHFALRSGERHSLGSILNG